ncbi:hypothetical protein IF1G_03713 [Cordyceps javanica]|uniref:Uncharacterized protein n=1 Tax=Cordyceps javanica TaxID=43265 RepID=A0A545V8C5_9HYPO|nr:hypothetical protein IF1G_03713 [Cordyceps javanica]
MQWPMMNERTYWCIHSFCLVISDEYTDGAIKTGSLPGCQGMPKAMWPKAGARMYVAGKYSVQTCRVSTRLYLGLAIVGRWITQRDRYVLVPSSLVLGRAES